KDLALRYPRVRVEEDRIWARDGNLYTSAGVSAGMDLALALIEEDLGSEVALAVARAMVMYLRRPGDQSQYSAPLRLQAAKPPTARASRRARSSPRETEDPSRLRGRRRGVRGAPLRRRGPRHAVDPDRAARARVRLEPRAPLLRGVGEPGPLRPGGPVRRRVD